MPQLEFPQLFLLLFSVSLDITLGKRELSLEIRFIEEIVHGQSRSAL